MPYDWTDSPVDMAAPLSVAVFAHNEQALIGACLDSLMAAADGRPLDIYVLINGCRDRTEEIVRTYARRNSAVHPIPIRLGDKANAWNLYVHELARPGGMHVFMDGDVRAAPGALAALARTLAENPDAHAAAALPQSGRSMHAFRAKLIDNHELAGNLYAVRGTAIQAFRGEALRLPVGLYGEDGLVSTLLRWDLDTLGPCRLERIAASHEAGFRFDSLSPAKLQDWRIYRNRKIRYAVRRLQGRMLYPLLWSEGVRGMPRHVSQLYAQQAHVARLAWRGGETLFDLLALRQMRRQLAGAEGQQRRFRRARV